MPSARSRSPGAPGRRSGSRAACTVRVVEAIPPHVGLGSGTKLALAVTAALAALAGQTPEPETIARAAGRGARSAVGLWTFVLGGLVVEGGRRPGVERPGPAAGPPRDARRMALRARDPAAPSRASRAGRRRRRSAGCARTQTAPRSSPSSC